MMKIKELEIRKKANYMFSTCYGLPRESCKQKAESSIVLWGKDFKSIYHKDYLYPSEEWKVDDNTKFTIPLCMFHLLKFLRKYDYERFKKEVYESV